jgi:hypothetical protein
MKHERFKRKKKVHFSCRTIGIIYPKNHLDSVEKQHDAKKERPKTGEGQKADRYFVTRIGF